MYMKFISKLSALLLLPIVVFFVKVELIRFLNFLVTLCLACHGIKILKFMMQESRIENCKIQCLAVLI